MGSQPWASSGDGPIVEWRAPLQSGDIEGGVAAPADLADEIYGHLRMEGYGPVLSTSERVVGLAVSTDEPDVAEALRWLREIAVGFEAALAKAGHPAGVAHIEVGLAEDD